MPQHTILPRPRYHACFSPVLALALGFTAIGVQAATPDAGSLQRAIEREIKPAIPAAQPLQPTGPAPIKAPSGPQITVKAFRFVGNTLFDEAALQVIVKPWLDKPLGMTDLHEAATAVAEAYRAAGWVVNAFLPRQDVTEGVITIQIIEAKFGGTRIDGPAATQVRTDLILDRLQARQQVGAPLNSVQLDRGLLLADDLPGVALTGALGAGQKEGETDLFIQMTDESRGFGDINLDNQGSRSTGRSRASVGLHRNSPLGVGDLIDANLLHTEGSDYVRLAYTRPLGADGLKLAINGSLMRYELVAPEFLAMQGKGTSNTLGAAIDYPVIRTRMRNLYASLNWEGKGYRTEASNAVQSEYRIDNWTLGLSGNLFDSLGGGGANSLSLGLVHGEVDHGALAGHFQKLTWSLARQQALADTLSLYLAVAGQRAGKDLDTAERFYLGGASGVRAYPSSEGGGSDGQMANLELRWRLANGVNLTGFYDWGHVKNFAAGALSYDLKGFGLSAGWATAAGLALKATWAYRDGQNPNPTNPTNTGTDQDGSLHRNRFWLSASLPF